MPSFYILNNNEINNIPFPTKVNLENEGNLYSESIFKSH